MAIWRPQLMEADKLRLDYPLQLSAWLAEIENPPNPQHLVYPLQLSAWLAEIGNPPNPLPVCCMYCVYLWPSWSYPPNPHTWWPRREFQRPLCCVYLVAKTRDSTTSWLYCVYLVARTLRPLCCNRWPRWEALRLLYCAVCIWWPRGETPRPLCFTVCTW